MRKDKKRNMQLKKRGRDRGRVGDRVRDRES
jgi:hypothetical protein